MVSGKNVFIIGPGFIGWNILDLLVAEGYSVSALVRRKEHGQAIEKSGAKVVYGDLDDSELITEHTAKNDITLHTATADHISSAMAVLEGAKSRAKEKKSTIYIHTSGTGCLEDGVNGNTAGERIYRDDDPADIDSLPASAPHRSIDLAIVKAQKELGESAKICIMMPPLIYGFNDKHQRLSIQVPFQTRYALKAGHAGHVGKGLPIWSVVHVKDLARGYVAILHKIESSPPTYVLNNPYFFCENGTELSWREIGQGIGQGLYAIGKIKDPEPRAFKEEEYKHLMGPATPGAIGANSRSRAVRLRELGWRPREKGIWESFGEDELPAILAEGGGAS